MNERKYFLICTHCRRRVTRKPHGTISNLGGFRKGKFYCMKCLVDKEADAGYIRTFGGAVYEHDYGDGDKNRDEYFCQSHNPTTARETLFAELKSGEKPVQLCEKIKGGGWRECELKPR